MNVQKKYTAVVLLIIFFGILSACKKKSDDNDCPVCPVVTSVNPTHGHVGDTVIITGTNFGSNAMNNIVRFNGKAVDAADMLSASSTEMRVRVPSKCGNGPVTVAIDADLYSDSGPLFTYEFRQVVSVFAGQEGVSAVPLTEVPLTDAQFNNPGKILIDQAGILCVMDDNNSRIRKFDPSINKFKLVTIAYSGMLKDFTLDLNNNLYITAQDTPSSTFCSAYKCITGTYTASFVRVFDISNYGILLGPMVADEQQNMYCSILNIFGDGSFLVRVPKSLSIGNDTAVFGGPMITSICRNQDNIYMCCRQWTGVDYSPYILRMNIITNAVDTVVTPENCNGITAYAMSLNGSVPYVYYGTNFFNVNAAGQLVVYPTPSIGQVRGFAFAANGDLYVSVGHCIKKITLE